MRVPSILVLAMLLGLCGAKAQEAPRYTLYRFLDRPIQVGTLRFFGRQTGFRVAGMSNTGYFAGNVYNGYIDYAHRFHGGTLERLFTSNTRGSVGSAVNDLGWVAGHYEDAPNRWFTCVWDPEGRFIPLPQNFGDRTCIAWDINNLGWVVGSAFPNSGAVLWRDGRAQVLGTIGFGVPRAKDVNNLGTVAGVETEREGDLRTWVWTERDGIRPTPGFVAWTGYTDDGNMNDNDEIPGTAGIGMPAIWRRGEIRRLPGRGYPSHINNRGEVIGDGGDVGLVLWSGGVRYDVLTLLPPEQRSKFRGISRVIDFNDKGDILVGASTFDNTPATYILRREN